jgi:hypothetical protein
MARKEVARINKQAVAAAQATQPRLAGLSTTNRLSPETFLSTAGRDKLMASVDPNVQAQMDLIRQQEEMARGVLRPGSISDINITSPNNMQAGQQDLNEETDLSRAGSGRQFTTNMLITSGRTTARAFAQNIGTFTHNQMAQNNADNISKVFNTVGNTYQSVLTGQAVARGGGAIAKLGGALVIASALAALALNIASDAKKMITRVEERQSQQVMNRERLGVIYSSRGR